MQHTVTGKIVGGEKLQAYLRKLALRLGEGGEARIGFLEGVSYPVEQGGLPVASVAFWNEYGTSKAPPRPFFRNMIEDQQETWARKLGAAALYSGYSARATLEIVAEDIKGHLDASIKALQDPPLAASTVARKGFAKPLIHTSWMLHSIDWVVDTKRPVKS